MVEKAEIHCSSWKLALEFRNDWDTIRVVVPKDLKELEEAIEDSRGWLILEEDYFASVEELEDAVKLYKLARNKDFVQDLEKTLNKIISKYIKCKEEKR